MPRFAIGLVAWTRVAFWHLWCTGTAAEECVDRWLRVQIVLLKVAYCFLAMQVGGSVGGGRSCDHTADCHGCGALRI
jgi:hypothetical protein